MKSTKIKSEYSALSLSVDDVFRLFERFSVLIVILISIGGEAVAASPSANVKIDSGLTSMSAIRLKMGANAVQFWGQQTRFCNRNDKIKSNSAELKCYSEVQKQGVIIKLENPYQYYQSAFIAYVSWKSPNDLLYLGASGDQDKDGSYLIQNESFMGFTNIRAAMFLQGIKDGHKETFIAYVSRIPKGEAPFMNALPVKISIYGFSAGTPASYSYSFSTHLPPSDVERGSADGHGGNATKDGGRRFAFPPACLAMI